MIETLTYECEGDPGKLIIRGHGMDGSIEIFKERFKQEFWLKRTPEYDRKNNSEKQLISAANMLSNYDIENELTYLYRDMPPLNWNKEHWQKMCDKSYKERLVIAGALIAAEIDRVNQFINE